MRPAVRRIVTVLCIVSLIGTRWLYYRSRLYAVASRQHLDSVAKLNKFDYAGAVDEFSVVIAVYPDHADSYYCRGFALSKKKDWSAAIADFDRAIEFSKTPMPRANAERAIARTNLGNLAGAMDDANTAVRIDPTMADAYRARGGIAHALGQLADARADFTKAIELDPADAWQWAHRALIQQALGDTERGLHDMREALHRQPTIEHAPELKGRLKVVPAP